ncbi:beta subunit of ribonucleotide reductase [Blyttiomyces helicus]|uniref:Beta subunit of ribonucleotide reductase n=1 Tax=Blyttiomyces helicus TaxID=388810 RepID=A0A4P9WPP9_9FUNG|nr:beta subunit of ribonucleotide reductase [Blyttiomyces helicus]|eukprot:RKO94512.1 beta subunit of ribonucleotide reductase [Blyttiomyces helicus]
MTDVDKAGTKEVDDILVHKKNRFTLYPIKYPKIWEFYKTGVNSFWVVEEIDLSKDLIDWKTKMTDDERFFVENVLAFFANSDGIVNENLIEHFERDVQIIEAKYFYRFQGTIENIHAEAYALLIDTYIDDDVKKDYLFNAIENIPCVKKKAEWALKWISNEESTFGERLLAFACVEGIFFSGSFAAIFWLRKRNLLPGLAQANTLISRDEGLHQRFACHLYKNHVKIGKPSEERAYEIVRQACELEKEFQMESLPVDLIGMNKNLMGQYIEYVSDFLLQMVGLNPTYNSKNPFDFMENISLDSCENFFEKKATNYSMGMSVKEFALDEDF